MTVIRTARLACLGLIAMLLVACSAAPAPSTSPPAPSKPAALVPPSGGPTPFVGPTVPDPTPTFDEGAGQSADAWLAVGRLGASDLEVIIGSTAESVYRLPAGVPSDRWGTLLYARQDGPSTVVADVAVQPDLGAAGGRSVGGTWRLPTVGLDPMPSGVSADRHTVVLVEAGTPVDPSRTRFAIFSPWPTANAARIIDLAGRFDYDALSPDGRILYVVQHLPGPPDAHYQVRALDVSTGVMRSEVVADKNLSDEAMGGYPVAQVRHDDGLVLTLYRGAEHPFVHALDSNDAWALCIDLPATGQPDALAAADWGLVSTADGRSTLALNATLGLALRIDDANLAVTASVRFDPLASTAISLAKFGHSVLGTVGRRAALSPDGTTVFAAGQGGIARLAVDGLDVTGRWLAGQVVEALAVTPDGRAVYALLHAGGRIVRLDATTGAIVGTVPGAGFDRLVAIANW